MCEGEIVGLSHIDCGRDWWLKPSHLKLVFGVEKAQDHLITQYFDKNIKLKFKFIILVFLI